MECVRSKVDDCIERKVGREAHLISNKAKYIPIQFRLPTLNGTKRLFKRAFSG